MSLRSDRVVKLFDSFGGETPVSVRERARQLSSSFLEARAALPLAPGDVAGNYEVLEALGSGGQAVVYRAKHAQIGRHVALKVPRREVGDRLLREAQLAARLEHPAIARVEDIQLGGEVPFMVLELCEKGSLEDLLDEHPGGLPIDAVKTIATSVLRALAFAHREGVVHRDVKPANILFDRAGNAKVADFGIGTMAAQDGLSVSVELSQLSLMAGTPLYVAPEQENPALRVGGKLDGRADLFSFGKVLFQMLTGASPRTIRPPSRVRKGLDPAWDDFVFKLLEERPEDRIPSADAALLALPGNAAIVPVATPVAPPPPAPPPATPRYMQRDAETICRVAAAIYLVALWFVTASIFTHELMPMGLMPSFGLAFAAAFSLYEAKRAARAKTPTVSGAFAACLGAGLALVETAILTPYTLKLGDLSLTLFATIPLQALGLTLAWLGHASLAPPEETAPTRRERELEWAALAAFTALVDAVIASLFFRSESWGALEAAPGLTTLSIFSTWLTWRAWTELRAVARRETPATPTVAGALAPGAVTGLVCALLVIPAAVIPKVLHFPEDERAFLWAVAAGLEVCALLFGGFARVRIALSRGTLGGRWLADGAIFVGLLNLVVFFLANYRR